jgi:hypothetical protein
MEAKMESLEDRLCIVADKDTEPLINFIFRELSDEDADNVKLDRMVPESGGVARELLTTGAILTFSTTLAVQIFRLIERWMEQQRQAEARKLIYEAATQNPEALKILSDLEKLHSNVSVELAKVRPALPSILKGKPSGGRSP